MSDLVEWLEGQCRCDPEMHCKYCDAAAEIAALGDIVLATDEPYCTCPDDYMAGVHHPDCISQKGDSTTDQPVAIPLTSAEIAALRERLREAERIVREFLLSDDGSDDPFLNDCRAFVWLTLAPAKDPDEIVNAQHDETGRLWQGKRSQIPPRFYECIAPAKDQP